MRWRTTEKSVIQKGTDQHCGVGGSFLAEKKVDVDMDKKDAIKTIVKCAALFRENYDGKQLLLVCANNSYSNIAVLETSFDGKN